MKICIASDHAGFDAKQDLICHLRNTGHAVSDCGTHSDESCDYPDYAAVVARAVSRGDCDRGILICGTGIGMSLVANRFEGVRSAVAHSDYTVEVSRTHNNANVLCLGSRVLSQEQMRRFTEVFLTTEFADARHSRRIDKLMSYDDPDTRAAIPPPAPFQTGACPGEPSD